MRDDKVVLYAHAGSGNHGCEALVNTISGLLQRQVLVVSNNSEEDRKYSLGDLCELKDERKIDKHFLTHAFYYGYRKIFHDQESFLRYRFREITGKKAYVWNLSIGGDNYCYENMLQDMMLTNSMLNHQGSRTVLVGCSIEPDLLKRQDVVKDMHLYQAIFARESLTYEALRQAGLRDKAFLFPDSAFLLKKKERELPDTFVLGNTIGINVSPMIMENEKIPGMVMQSYQQLIKYIIHNTDMHIALIPHVVWERNDDRVPLRQLYQMFCDSGRVAMIADGTCEELKGDIARCRMFIGARTHATIAAYSSAVPTLVVGYSVKAKGIAKDLFGTYENYVLPVQQLQEPGQLIDAFRWLLQEEASIRNHLEQVLPDYISCAEKAGEKLKEFI